MKRKLITFFISAAMIISATGILPLSASADTADDIARSLTETYGATSVQYALLDNGEITASGTSGVYSRSENKQLTNEHMYGIGSVSKMYTAAAVMSLVDDGKISLDEPVTTYLPDFKMADERYRQITVRMLLNHSSGLNGSSMTNAFLLGDNDTFAHDNLLKALSTQTLKADPGAFSVYCNDGFTLAELVVEAVSGASFTDYLHTNFLEPLELTHTKTPLDNFDRTMLAKVYYPLFPQELPADTLNVIGTGGVYSTAEELCKFGEVLIGNKPELLSKESAEAMQAAEYKNGIWPDAEINTIGYGLGWDSVDLEPFSISGITALNKGGDSILSHASIIALPEYDLIAAVTSSGGSSSLDGLLAQKLLVDALSEKGVQLQQPQPPQPLEEALMPSKLEEYSGLYGTTGNIIDIIVKDNKLVVPGKDTVPDQIFLYSTDGTFKTADGTISLEFADAENGHTYLQMTVISVIPGFGQTQMTYFDCQRIEQNPLNASVKAAWEKRNGKKYYVLDEKATSQMWMLSGFSPLQVDLENGYARGCKIIDENNAKNIFQIPVMAGRDIAHLSFYTKDGIEYLESANTLMFSEDAVAPIWSGTDSITTIQPDGYVRWYRCGEGTAGKQMTLQIPENAAFAVFDEKGTSVQYSIVTGENQVTLPENASIAFIGVPGDVFRITME
jgi:CubicO group peptidase (beta-lactamase class C family)